MTSGGLQKSRIVDGGGRGAGPGPGRGRAPWVGAEPPVRAVVGTAAGALLGVAAVEIVLLDTLGWLFGTGLVLVAVGTALTVRVRDLFTAGVFPPLLLIGALVVVAVLHPTGIAVTQLDPAASAPQRVIAGFVDLAGALVVAHGLALLLVALRVRVARLQRRPS